MIEHKEDGQMQSKQQQRPKQSTKSSVNVVVHTYPQTNTLPLENFQIRTTLYVVVRFNTHAVCKKIAKLLAQLPGTRYAFLTMAQIKFNTQNKMCQTASRDRCTAVTLGTVRNQNKNPGKNKQTISCAWTWTWIWILPSPSWPLSWAACSGRTP